MLLVEIQSGRIWRALWGNPSKDVQLSRTGASVRVNLKG